MGQLLEFQENNINLVFEITEENKLCLLHMSKSDFDYTKIHENEKLQFTPVRILAHNSGTWSAKEYLTMGCVINMEAKSALMWQIENNGSWQWEISDIADRLYLKISGPNENKNHWWKNLRPNDSFQTIPAAVAVADGGFEEALEEMTKYRRRNIFV